MTPSIRLGIAVGLGACTPFGASAEPPRPGEIVTWGLLPPAPTGTFTDLSLGSFHALALRPDGTLAGWGQWWTSPPPGPFLAFAAAGVELDMTGFGVRLDGSTVHWGTGPACGPCITPSGKFKDVRGAGWSAVWQRGDGTLQGWGLCGGCMNVPSGVFTSFDISNSAGVGIRPDGTLQPWGYQYSPPSLLNAPPGTFLRVSMGWNAAVALRTDGTLAAWGDNSHNLLSVPPGTFIDVRVAYVNIGPEWAVAVRSDGTLVAWGDGAALAGPPPAGKFVAARASSWRFGAALAGCYADCNDDGVLTVQDFGCFQTKYVAGDPYADCNGQGGLTVQDFGCFQTQFVLGCP